MASMFAQFWSTVRRTQLQNDFGKCVGQFSRSRSVASSSFAFDGSGVARKGQAAVVKVDANVKKWGAQPTTYVSLRDLVEIGLNSRRRRKHAQFLHSELKIRFARQVLALSSLPDDLPGRPGIRDVIKWYTQFAYVLDAAPEPINANQDHAFLVTCARILEEHSEIIQAMALGVQDFMAERGELYEVIQPEIDHLLRQFFMARIGLRFLLQHFIESQWNRPGHSGNLEIECAPSLIAKGAASEAAAICRTHLGFAPEIVVTETTPGTFTYVPVHLHYMLTEIFKNSCRAVVEHHAHRHYEHVSLPPVHCQIVRGVDEIGIRVTDEGGGFSRARAKDIWKFMWSTYKMSPWGDDKQFSSLPRPMKSLATSAIPLQRPAAYALRTLQQQQLPRGVLAGYGVGLTLSRLHAQYWGGDLNILSLDGLGTDVYLHLSHLGSEIGEPNYARIS